MKGKLVLFLILFTLASSSGVAFAQWPMDGHDSGRSGYYSGVFSTSKDIYWQASFNTSVMDVVAGGDSIYVRLHNSTADQVVALNAATGASRWTANVPRGLDDNLIITDNVLLVAHENGVVGLNMNGETAWEITTDNCDEGILLNGDRLLLIDTYGISVYTLSSRMRLWGKTYMTDKFRSQFVLSANAVYLQSANTLTAFDVSTGNVQYTKNVPVGGDANIVYADGKIYEGTNDGCLICIDPNTGDKSWTFKTDGNLTGDLLPSAYTPAVGGGNLVFGAVDNKLYCLDESGNLKWKTSSVNLDYDDQPAITDNLVYVIDSYDRLRCFDIATGNELWKLSVTTNSLAASPIGAPILFNGKIFGMTTAASSNHQYYVFNIIPEFTSYIAILLFASATLLTVLLHQRKHRLCNARR